MRLELVRAKKGSEVGGNYRHVNGKAGHTLAIVMELHVAVATLGNAPDNLRAYVNTTQLLADLMDLHKVNKCEYRNLCNELEETQGTYASGVMFITGE